MTAAAPNLRTVPAGEAQAALQSFDQILSLIAAKRDPVLTLDVQRFVRPVEVKPGVFSFTLVQGAPANLPHRLSAKLKEWTGRPWMMDVRTDVAGEETVHERERREAAEAQAALERDPFVLALKSAFPGAEIVGVRKLTPPPATEVPPAPDEPDED